ncbi:gamma-aminobutyric acid type B receptor subunit 2-like [Uloborus diversus]|uniref:gamma-aminobutyric acid type B receptor subunit 2-like n=1 Tax=Uloborus diversus TaxID=327109 RepID=UPI0024099190|nr:gamma-aminobutyric acid type B receptor subunit 2-like [Uloborus diversus]
MAVIVKLVAVFTHQLSSRYINSFAKWLEVGSVSCSLVVGVIRVMDISPEICAKMIALREHTSKIKKHLSPLEFHNETQCDSGVAVDAFFHSLYRQPTMSVLLGTGSSEVTERLARVVSRWNVIQMSYGASSPALSDRKNFPMFFRTVAPDSSHNAAIVAFISNHKWSHVAAFHEQGDRHALPMTKLINDLEEVNVTVTLTKGASAKDYKDHLQEMKAQDCRILLCSFSAILFKKVFCQIYKLGMHVGEYVWILLGDAAELWWRESSDIVCNRRRIANDIRSVVTVSSHYELRENGSAISMITILDVLADIGYNAAPRSIGYIPHTYDAVWAIALAFNHVEEMWRSTNSSITLGDFTYDKHVMAQQLSNAVENLHFIGVSGPVSFHKSDRVGITAFHQKQGNLLKLAAVYEPEAAELDEHCLSCSGFQWQGGNPPISSRVIIRRIAVLDRRVFICVTALAVLGVLLALIFLSFNLYYRKVKFIKLSSPNLNNFVVVGCVLVYIAVILLGMDHGTLASDDHFPVICSARAFLLSGGFSLAFGCMFIKTYRVYYIFIRANTGIVKSKLLHDQQLLGMVSVLLLVDCILVTLWVTIDPMERQLTDLSMQVNKDERNVVYLYLREHCNSPHMAKWLGSLYIYKGLLLVVGCYMAWETRHVKVPALNDSQYIGMSVYNVVITSIIVVALANIIPADRYTLTFVLVSTLIFVSTTTTLCILFVPKMHTILMDPDGTTIIATPGVKVECKTRRFAMDEPRESVYRAEVLNRALKRELLELDEEYNKLATKLGLSPCVVREPKLNSDIQDDDSDDGLPPWLADYNDFSSSRNDIWYTNRSTIASAFSTIHSVALQIPSTSNFQSDINTNKKHTASGEKPNKQAGSSTSISTGNSTKISLTGIKPVRTFLSDRALNKLKTLQTLHESAFDDIDGSPNHARNLTQLDKRLNSEPKLYSKLVCQDISLMKFPTRSLNQVSVSVIEGSYSDHSKNTTSITSDWTTAPLYESTSFSTPPEDFFSSSNNGNDSSRDIGSINNHIFISCKEDDSSNSIGDCNNQNKKHLSGSETSENGSFSNNQSNTNAETSNNSISEATISDLSSDTKCKLDMEPVNTGMNSVVENATIKKSLNPDILQEAANQASAFSEQNTNLIQFHFDPQLIVERSSSETCTMSNEESSIMLVDNLEQLTIDPNKNSAKSKETQSNDSENNQILQCWNQPVAEPCGNNFEEQPRTMQIDNLRNQIFRLERELILLQLDQSEAVDL